MMKTNNPFYAEQQANPDAARVKRPFQGGWFFGTVVAVEPSRDLLFLRTQETRRREVIHLAPATQFTVDGHPGSSRYLCSGQRVRIHCRFANDELAADNIAIGPADYPGTPKSKVIPPHPEPGLNRGDKMS